MLDSYLFYGGGNVALSLLGSSLNTTKLKLVYIFCVTIIWLGLGFMLVLLHITN